MNIAMNDIGAFSILRQCVGDAGMMKSTREKLERQQKAQNQIEFLENQKSNLKNMKCDSLEDIADKLEMFHSYEDQIAAVRQQYNNEQMMHIMDEATERGEQIAKKAKENEPKTEEERKKEMLAEALGTDENGGVLTEIMEELSESAEQLSEEITDAENVEQLSELADTAEKNLDVSQEEWVIEEHWKDNYVPLDVRV